MLDSLRPKSEIDLLDLTDLVKDGKYFNLLPKALDDVTLLALAKELRLTEKMVKGETDSLPNFAVPLFIVMELVRGRRGVLKKEKISSKFELSESDVIQTIQILQIGVEREIVGRIVGVKSEDHEQSWLEAFDGFAVEAG